MSHVDWHGPAPAEPRKWWIAQAARLRSLIRQAETAPELERRDAIYQARVAACVLLADLMEQLAGDDVRGGALADYFRSQANGFVPGEQR